MGKDLLEKIEYPDDDFKLLFCEDNFDDYLNREISYHWHSEIEFSYVIKGKADCMINNSSDEKEHMVLEKGDGVFVNSEALHRLSGLVPETVVFGVVFPVDFFSTLSLGDMYRKYMEPVLQSGLYGVFIKKTDEANRRILDYIWQLHGLQAQDKIYELRCMELLCGLWGSLYLKISAGDRVLAAAASDQVKDNRIRTMISFIQSNYQEDISVNDIAEAASISRSECFRCFKEIIGKTPFEYLGGYRLSRAADMLINTNRTMADICFSCGFKSASYFGKLFRENCGVSPGVYRKRKKGWQ